MGVLVCHIATPAVHIGGDDSRMTLVYNSQNYSKHSELEDFISISFLVNTITINV